MWTGCEDSAVQTEILVESRELILPRTLPSGITYACGKMQFSELGLTVCRISSDVKRGQNREAEAEANFWRLRPRPRPKIIVKQVPSND